MRSFYIFSLFFSFSEVSLACIIQRDLTDELKNYADIVFEGEATKYTPSMSGRPGQGIKPAEITFRIDEVLKGPKLSEIEANWINGTFGESKSLSEFKKRYGNKIQVGLITPKAFSRITKCKNMRSTNAGTGKTRLVEKCTSHLIGAAHTKEHQPDKNWVVQGPCTLPYLTPVRPYQ